jgi:hypothetical protein
MFLLAHQLGILFLLSLPPALSRRTALAYFARLGLLGLFCVLTVDLGENLLDVWVRIRVDEVAEQVGQA